MIDQNQNLKANLDKNEKDVLMNYIDKIFMNYRDTTKIIVRLIYSLFFLFFLIGYISIERKQINFFGVIREIPPEHVAILAPLILGFIYMAIGGFSIYKERLKENINQTYTDLNLSSKVRKKENDNNFLVYPSFSEIVTLLSMTGKKESETVEYVYAFINLLRILFVFVLPLGLLVYIITPKIHKEYYDFSHTFCFVGLYLLLPSVGVVSITWKLHKIYYKSVEHIFKKRNSIKDNKKIIGFMSWLIGILGIDLIILVIFFIFFILSTISWKDNIIGFQWSNLIIIFSDVLLSILIISYTIVVIGVLFLFVKHHCKELISILEKKIENSKKD